MNENYLKQLGDQIALTHWAQSNEKTYEEICDRVVNYICDDQSEEGRNYNRRMKDLLKSKKFIPNSPCWINSGTDMKNLFACYVIDLKDNMSSIMDTAKRMAMIMKEGGGVGVSLTPIRAEGARVGGEGSNRTASGPISFLKVFDAVVGAVKSAGVRRGAALANLKTGHPDLIKFIKCKEDQNQINNFNLSVAITDEFMDDVINDSDKVWAEEDGVKYTASAIYKMIVHHMWQNGEPGVQFIDTVNDVDGKYTGRPEFREFNTGIEVSNPCVTGDTLILTDKGYLPIKDLVGKKINIWNGFEWSEVEPRKTGENEKLLKISFSNGSELRCTPYHKFVIQPAGRCYKHKSPIRKQAVELSIGDRLIKNNWPVIQGDKELPNAYTQGFYSGDGSLGPKGPRIQFYGEKVKLLQECSVFSDHKKALNSFNLGKVNKVGCCVEVPFTDKTFVPDASYTIKSRLDWLAGLCDSDGSLNSVEGSIAISSVDKDFLNRVKLMLNTLGITSAVSLMRKATEQFMSDGRGGLKLYNCKDCYRIIISGSNVESLKALGFRTKRVKLANASQNRSANRFVTVTSVSECEEREDVFCLTEFKRHTMIVNGVISSQCSETYLKPNEACNLASVNLYHFVNPFWKGKDENKDMALRQELKQVVEDAIEFLNKMMDKSETPFPEINETVKQSRKVGLGVMGLADYLSAKGIVYGSPEAIHEAADVFAFISKTAEEYSLRKGYKNATLTVQAPTGTTGLVGEVSTGIEPHFLRCWTRHSIKMGDLLMYPKSLRDYIYARCDSAAESDSPEMKAWSSIYQAMESNDMKRFSDLIERGQEELGISNEIKKFWPTAHEVTPKQHLAMLAAVQRHIHNAVSKTINLPHDATEEDVRDLITTAWRSRCKGFTCYRDGSRDSQPLNAIDNKDKSDAASAAFDTEFKKQVREGKLVIMPSPEYDYLNGVAKILEELNDSVDFDLPSCVKMIKGMREGKETIVNVEEYKLLKKKAEAFDKFNVKPTYTLVKDINVPCKRPRPNVTYGETVKTKIGCGSIYITVNKDENGTCEVFTNLGRTGGCPSQSEATSRLISLALRSGVKVEDVIDQLKGIRCMNTMRKGGIKQPDGTVVLSCPDAIGKAIEKISNDWIKPEESDNAQSPAIGNIETEVDTDGNRNIKVYTALLGGNMICPDCGKELERDGGCVICRHCGYSKCG